MKIVCLLFVAAIAMSCSSCAIANPPLISLQKLRAIGGRDDSVSKRKYLIEEVVISKNRSPSLAVESDRAKLVAVAEDDALGKNKIIWLKYDRFALPDGVLAKGRIVELSHSKHGDPVSIKFIKPDGDDAEPQ